jgi:hypothetical protein
MIIAPGLRKSSSGTFWAHGSSSSTCRSLDVRFNFDQRFFSVTAIPAACMFKKTVPRSGFVLMTLVYCGSARGKGKIGASGEKSQQDEEKDSFASETFEHHNPFAT